MPPVSVSSHAAVEASGRLQSLAAQCAAHLQGLAAPETTRLMLAWLAGYEQAERAALDALRRELQVVAGAGQVATGNGLGPSRSYPAQVSPPQ